MKTCGKCGEQKPLSEFYKRPGSPDGLRANCKACYRSSHEEWKVRNPGRKAEIDRHLYLGNKEERNRQSAEYYRAHKERMNALGKLWAEANREKVRADNRAKRERDGDRIRAKRRQHYIENKPRYVAQARKRDIDKIRATPPWVDLEEITQLYVLADQMTRETGVEYHVDHKIPLRHPLVCGLHVPPNLQVLTAQANLAKGNSFQPGAY